MYISPAHTVPPLDENILAPWILMGEMVDGLVGRGHDIQVFAAKGSVTKGHLHHFNIDPTVLNKSVLTPDDYKKDVADDEDLLFTRMMETVKEDGVPLVHIHHPIERLYPLLSKYPDTQFVFTFHDPIGPERFADLQKIQTLGNCHFVSISNAQRSGVPLTFAATVYNGVSTTLFQPIPEREPYAPFVAVGRVVPNKGFEDAISAVRATDSRLVIAGQVYQDKPEMLDYFNQKIKPEIDGKHVFMEPLLKREHLVGHYQTAKALLFPIHWEEPFGLVMVEAMACGTPVIAYNRGSVSEVVQDGVTGFIIDPDDTDRPGKGSWIIKKQGVEGLIEAIKRIEELDRTVCRKLVEEKFSLDTMVHGYENVYQKILKKK